MTQLIKTLEQKLNIQFNQPDIIQQAFRHTSYANEQATRDLQHNERLEFLGDAVLELMVSDYLYHQYPKLPEGQLTRMRAQLVREESLAYLARELKFDHYLRLGRGEELSGGRQRNSILADCFEAFLGAIYEDSGYATAQQFLEQVMLTRHDVLLSMVSQDYKTLFQERVQQKGSVLIQYRLLETSGPAHAQVFKVGLYVDHHLIANGSGTSKKQAEMQAAQIGLQQVDLQGNIVH